MNFEISFFLGALAPTLLITLLICRVIRQVSKIWVRVLISSVVSFFAVITLAGFGMANGGPFALEEALGAYTTPQIAASVIAFALLYIREKRKSKADE